MQNVLATILLFALGWAVHFGWNLVAADPMEASPEDVAEWIAGDDEWAAADIEAGDAAPAAAWLAEPDHAVFEGDRAQVRDLVERFEDAGAEGVWMIGIEEWQGREWAGAVAVELPASGPLRERVFAVESGWWDGHGTPDAGQRYLVVAFD